MCNGGEKCTFGFDSNNFATGHCEDARTDTVHEYAATLTRI